MSRFSFRLARLLDLRSAMEREQARSVAQAVAQEEERRQRYTLAVERYLEARQEARCRTADVERAGAIRNLELVVEAAGRVAEQERSALESAAQERELAQLHYQIARRERRSIEKLREGALQAWLRDRDRDEQKQLDEASRLLQLQGRAQP